MTTAQPCDRLARLLDLDPWTRAGIADLLGRLTPEEAAAADVIRDQLTAELGSFLRGSAEMPDFPGPDTPNSAWVAGVLVAAPNVADWMAARDIGEPVIAATLADVGRQLRLHRAHTGRVGFDAAFWMFAVLSGSLYQLGRLQFDLRQFRPDEPTPPVDTGAWALDVHIPATGPLTPNAVAASFNEAAAFFARWFPEQPVRFAICGSWLLDPALGEHLADGSNIVRFQRMFTRYGDPRDDELDALYFTFGQRSLEGLDRLPRTSSLQRLVLDRLAAGQHWSVVRGFRRLPAPISPRKPNSP